MNKKILSLLFVFLLLLTGCSQKSTYVAEIKTHTEYSMYIGNKNTHKFHCPDCHTLPYEENRIYFTNADDAMSSGFIPCKNCTP